MIRTCTECEHLGYCCQSCGDEDHAAHLYEVWRDNGDD